MCAILIYKERERTPTENTNQHPGRCQSKRVTARGKTASRRNPPPPIKRKEVLKMKIYKIYNVAGEYLGTIQAKTADILLTRIIKLYGSDAYAVDVTEE